MNVHESSIFDHPGTLVAAAFILVRLFVLPIMRKRRQAAQEQSRNVEVDPAAATEYRSTDAPNPVDDGGSSTTPAWPGPSPASAAPMNPVRAPKRSSKGDIDPRGPFL